MTRHFAVLGSPISHSRSPLLHRAWYADQGIDAYYVAIDVSDLQSFLAEAVDFEGFSVTMPLKEQARRAAAVSDPLVEQSGVANTLLREPGGWSAHNTDVTGFQDLFDAAGLIEMQQVTIVGAGATAASAVIALASRAERINVMARSEQRAARVIGISERCRYTPWVADSPALAAELVVATTPAGAADDLNTSPSDEGILLDVLYAPWPTALAAGWGGRVIDGLELLARQAARQIELFFPGSDRALAYEVMIRAARAE